MLETVDSSNWERARLIPVSKSRNSENETRATSALLAVLSSVDEFGTSLTRPLGAPKGTIDTYTEVSFKHQNGKLVRPDGVIRASRGNRSWTALVEVKTGEDKLNSEQVETYLDIAKDNEFDCVITISNEIAKIPGEHPTRVDRRKLSGKVNLHHLSWSRVLTEAVLVKSHRGIEDPDQAWILGELIRYLEHPNAGTFDFKDMGENWVGVRDAIKNGTLRQTDDEATEVAGKWEELLTFASLHLGRRLGDNVQEVLTAKEKKDISVRIDNIVNGMVKERRMYGKIRIPHTVGDLVVMANLEAQKIEISVSLDAPSEGRAKTRVNWLLKQLRETKLDVRLDSWGARSRESLSEMLTSVRDNPSLLMPPENREITKFTITLSRKMGLKQRSGTKGSFIESAITAIDDFYDDVLQRLKVWQAAAPKPKKVDSAPSDEEHSPIDSPDEAVESPEGGSISDHPTIHKSPDFGSGATPSQGENNNLQEY